MNQCRKLQTKVAFFRFLRKGTEKAAPKVWIKDRIKRTSVWMSFFENGAGLICYVASSKS